ncbi:helix-turn-helix domain-containing protein [Nocardia sp. NBC_01503]|uniref:helix-turn-helix domain-containing protein n=1 Tax=Nocardia sp. NBC_01503 TaxID=2975997 RepID=UPI002E7B8C74|nr:helix-turn-helix domain-containing protein [Nocardia sp. NBC_01503]WTL32010.1 helix-turn-helix domain-containing protein [Nocardia sp. NBC_01503]
MQYIGRVPAPPLDRFIDDIYCLSGMPRHRRMLVPPMPSAHLFINLGEPIRLWDRDPPASPSTLIDGWFMGLRTKRFVVEYSAHVRLVGVHFKPWGIAAFTGIPGIELLDRCVPVDAVWQRSLDRIREQVHAIGSPARTLGFVERELRSRLTETPTRSLDLVSHTGARLASAYGSMPVTALTEAAGVSGNHLAAQFKSQIGVTPKRVARIYRFARLILSVDARRPVDWSEFAHSAGYFDQAHSSREFKDFTGYTPTEYLALRRKFPAEDGFPPDAGPIPFE